MLSAAAAAKGQVGMISTAAGGPELIASQLKAALSSIGGGLGASVLFSGMQIGAGLGADAGVRAALASASAGPASLFQTGGAVSDALRSIKALGISTGFTGGPLPRALADATTMQLQGIVGISGAMLALGAGADIGTATLPRASQWVAEQSVIGSALVDIARAPDLNVLRTSALMNAASLGATASWRTMMDGAMGTSLAGLRPAVVSAYAGLHASALPVATRMGGFALGRADAALAGALADQLERMRTEMSRILGPAGAAMTESRTHAGAGFATSNLELAAAGVDLETAIAEVARTGTLDSLVRFIDEALTAFARNTGRDVSGMGALTLLPLLVALFQVMIWLQPAWTPQPEATAPAGLDRVEREQHALSEEFGSLTRMLAQQEADNLARIPRAEVRGMVRVRTGPGRDSPVVARLEAGEIVGVRDREDGWALVFFRDPLTGAIGSGWVRFNRLAEQH